MLQASRQIKTEKLPASHEGEKTIYYNRSAALLFINVNEYLPLVPESWQIDYA